MTTATAMNPSVNNNAAAGAPSAGTTSALSHATFNHGHHNRSQRNQMAVPAVRSTWKKAPASRRVLAQPLLTRNFCMAKFRTTDDEADEGGGSEGRTVIWPCLHFENYGRLTETLKGILTSDDDDTIFERRTIATEFMAFCMKAGVSLEVANSTPLLYFLGYHTTEYLDGSSNNNVIELANMYHDCDAFLDLQMQVAAQQLGEESEMLRKALAEFQRLNDEVSGCRLRFFCWISM